MHSSTFRLDTIKSWDKLHKLKIIFKQLAAIFFEFAFIIDFMAYPLETKIAIKNEMLGLMHTWKAYGSFKYVL